MNTALRHPTRFRISDHAMSMARQRGVSISELEEALADDTFVYNNSEADPASGQYVFRYRDLIVVWTDADDRPTVLTIFHR